MSYVLQVRINNLYISNEQYEINILSLEGEKKKNTGISRGLVIRLIVIMKIFLFKI